MNAVDKKWRGCIVDDFNTGLTIKSHNSASRAICPRHAVMSGCVHGVTRVRLGYRQGVTLRVPFRPLIVHFPVDPNLHLNRCRSLVATVSRLDVEHLSGLRPVWGLGISGTDDGSH